MLFPQRFLLRPTLFCRLNYTTKGLARLPAHLSLHTTPSRFATAIPSLPTFNDGNPLIKQILAHPHIVQKIVDLTSLLQSKGLDLSSGQPSMLQTIKVMGDVEVKAKIRDLVQDMKNAGIELDAQSVMDLQKALRGEK